MIEWNAKGITRAQADGRYVKRFVNNVLAADSRLRGVATGDVPALEALAGPLVGNIPTDASPLLFQPDDGLIARYRIRSFRDNASAEVSAERFNGTWAAPTGVLAAQTVGQFVVRAYEPDTPTITQVGRIDLLSREDIRAAARGTAWRHVVFDVGSNVSKNVAELRGGGANIAEWRSLQNTWRLIATQTGQLRDPSDTATLIEWNATGLGFFGTAPIAKPTVTGAKGGNAALTSLLTQLAALGLVTDSTT